MSIKQKVFKYTRIGVGGSVSPSWYYKSNGYKYHNLISITHVMMDGFLCVNFILIFFRISLYIRIKNINKEK